MKTKIKDKKDIVVHCLKYAHSFYTETQCGQILDNMKDQYNYTDKELTCSACMKAIIKQQTVTRRQKEKVKYESENGIIK